VLSAWTNAEAKKLLVIDQTFEHNHSDSMPMRFAVRHSNCTSFANRYRHHQYSNQDRKKTFDWKNYFFTFVDFGSPQAISPNWWALFGKWKLAVWIFLNRRIEFHSNRNTLVLGLRCLRIYRWKGCFDMMQMPRELDPSLMCSLLLILYREKYIPLKKFH
jgi:hypothetical protein